MNKYLDILRLRHDCDRSIRQISEALGGVGTVTVQWSLRVAEQANLRSTLADWDGSRTAKADAMPVSTAQAGSSGWIPVDFVIEASVNIQKNFSIGG